MFYIFCITVIIIIIIIIIINHLKSENEYPLSDNCASID